MHCPKPLSVLLCAGLTLAALATGPVAAQAWPAKPVRLIVPYSAGSAIDVVARVIGQKVGDGWGQQMIIDNRTGANSIIGTEAGARAAPDGYTLLMANDAALAVNPSLYPKLPYDPLKDFAPITLAGANQLLLVVHPSVPARDVKELIALARERKGELDYGSGGNGSAQHLPMEMFMAMTGVRLTHVPYKALGPALNDVVGGQLPVMFAGMPGALPHVKAGKIRALAIASAKRSGAAPDIPTVAESGVPGFDYAAWVGYLAPAGTPPALVQRINADLIRAMNEPDVREKLAAVGFDIQTSTPDEFRALIGREIDKMGKLVRSAGIKAPQ
jgi:tripartite-type tricarboxylate transporter receptor subunit TctC